MVPPSFQAYHRRHPLAAPSQQDEFELFGAIVAAQLRRYVGQLLLQLDAVLQLVFLTDLPFRVSDEFSRAASLRLQKKLNDVIFESQMELLEHRN